MQRFLASNKAAVVVAGGLLSVAAVVALRRGGCCCRGEKKPAATSAPSVTSATSAASEPKPRLDAIVISGPSGVGKGTLISKLLADYPNHFGFSVSHTTRDPRPGEVNGTHYHFVTKEQIQSMIDKDEFLENCLVHGNIYGTSKASLAAVTAQGKVAIIEMDVQGAQKLRTRQGSFNFHYMFVTAPSLEELETRIRHRGADNDEKIRVRLETARSEFDFLRKSPEFFHTVLANNDLEAAYKQLVALLRDLGVQL